jgi:hypothetical protein
MVEQADLSSGQQQQAATEAEVQMLLDIAR